MRIPVLYAKLDNSSREWEYCRQSMGMFEQLTYWQWSFTDIYSFECPVLAESLRKIFASHVYSIGMLTNILHWLEKIWKFALNVVLTWFSAWWTDIRRFWSKTKNMLNGTFLAWLNYSIYVNFLLVIFSQPS